MTMSPLLLLVRDQHRCTLSLIRCVGVRACLTTLASYTCSRLQCTSGQAADSCSLWAENECIRNNNNIPSLFLSLCDPTSKKIIGPFLGSLKKIRLTDSTRESVTFPYIQQEFYAYFVSKQNWEVERNWMAAWEGLPMWHRWNARPIAAEMGSNWFHGQLSRVEAEALLRDHGFSEGLYLVRQSESAIGDFVLSVVHENDVIHYQASTRWEITI